MHLCYDALEHGILIKPLFLHTLYLRMTRLNLSRIGWKIIQTSVQRRLKLNHGSMRGADLAFALYVDLLTDSFFESFDTRWIFAHADDQLIAVPEDLHLVSLNLDRVRSYLMINLR